MSVKAGQAGRAHDAQQGTDSGWLLQPEGSGSRSETRPVGCGAGTLRHAQRQAFIADSTWPRWLYKFMWKVVVVYLPIAGGITWLCTKRKDVRAAARPQRHPATGSSCRPGCAAPSAMPRGGASGLARDSRLLAVAGGTQDHRGAAEDVICAHSATPAFSQPTARNGRPDGKAALGST